MDLQVLDRIASDEEKKAPLIRPYWGTVSEVIENGKKCKVHIDGDSGPADAYYQAINAVNVGNRVLLFYAGEQVVIIGASGVESKNYATIEELQALKTNETIQLVCGSDFSRTGNDVCKAIKKGVGAVCISAELTANVAIPWGGIVVNIPESINAKLSYGPIPAYLAVDNVISVIMLWNYGNVLKLWTGSIPKGGLLSLSFNYFI